MKAGNLHELTLATSSLFLFVASIGTTFAANPTDTDTRAQIASLEARVSRIEAMLGPALQTPEQQAAQMEEYQKQQMAQAEAQLAQWKADDELARRQHKWLNPEPWGLLRRGMARSAVETLLGACSSTKIVNSGGLDCWYRHGVHQALVSFQDGRLEAFSSPNF